MESILRREDKKKTVKYSNVKSPDLKELDAYQLDDKTFIYFKKDKSPEYIANKIALHSKKLNSVEIQLNKTEEVLLTHVKKVTVDE